MGMELRGLVFLQTGNFQLKGSFFLSRLGVHLTHLTAAADLEEWGMSRLLVLPHS